MPRRSWLLWLGSTLALLAAYGLSGQTLPPFPANHYKTLGVGRSATRDEVRLAWKAQAKRLHPDKHRSRSRVLWSMGVALRVLPSADTVMAEVNHASDVLSDAGTRRAYDATLQSRLHEERVRWSQSRLRRALNRLEGQAYDTARGIVQLAPAAFAQAFLALGAAAVALHYATILVLWPVRWLLAPRRTASGLASLDEKRRAARERQQAVLDESRRQSSWPAERRRAPAAAAAGGHRLGLGRPTN